MNSASPACHISSTAAQAAKSVLTPLQRTFEVCAQHITMLGRNRSWVALPLLFTSSVLGFIYAAYRLTLATTNPRIKFISKAPYL
jgi:hypothetical protein